MCLVCRHDEWIVKLVFVVWVRRGPASAYGIASIQTDSQCPAKLLRPRKRGVEPKGFFAIVESATEQLVNLPTVPRFSLVR